MSLLKYVILGAAAVYGYNYATKKRVVDGKSIVDDLKDKAPEWIDKAKSYKQDAETRYNNFANEYPE